MIDIDNYVENGLFKALLPAYDKDRYYINNRRINGCALLPATHVTSPSVAAAWRMSLAAMYADAKADVDAGL